jgi:hypothetical protein
MQNGCIMDNLSATSPNPPGENPSSKGSPPPGNKASVRRGRGAIVVATVLAVTLIVGGAVATTLVLKHRADVAAAQRAAAASRAAEAKADAERIAAEEAEAAELAAAQEDYRACRRQIFPLLDALQVVDARLNVGLSQSELSNLVGDASVAYARIDPHELGEGDCLSSGARLETALNAYSRTVDTWNDCIFEYSCDLDDIDPQLQRAWRSASRAVERAEDLLDRLDPESPSYVAAAGSQT